MRAAGSPRSPVRCAGRRRTTIVRRARATIAGPSGSTPNPTRYPRPTTPTSTAASPTNADGRPPDASCAITRLRPHRPRACGPSPGNTAKMRVCQTSGVCGVVFVLNAAAFRASESAGPVHPHSVVHPGDSQFRGYHQRRIGGIWGDMPVQVQARRGASEDPGRCRDHERCSTGSPRPSPFAPH